MRKSTSLGKMPQCVKSVTCVSIDALLRRLIINMGKRASMSRRADGESRIDEVMSGYIRLCIFARFCNFAYSRSLRNLPARSSLRLSMCTLNSKDGNIERIDSQDIRFCDHLQLAPQRGRTRYPECFSEVREQQQTDAWDLQPMRCACTGQTCRASEASSFYMQNLLMARIDNSLCKARTLCISL